MTTIWRSVDNQCLSCKQPVGKMTVRGSKIAVEKYFDNWGCWRKIPGKSEMQVMCCHCQKEENRRQRKSKKQ